MIKNQTQNYDDYIRALKDISRAITSELYLEDILKLIVMVTARVTDVAICSLWLVDHSEKPPVIRLKATQSIDPDYVKDRTLKLNEGVVGQVFSENKPLIIKDVLQNQHFKEKEMAAKLGLVSMIGVPLQAKHKSVLGVLNCFTTRDHQFSKTEINLIMAVASQAGVAILNTELMVKTRVIQEELETRKMVDRAKEILIKNRSLKPEAAHRWIQKRSMNTRKSMRQVAEAILLSEELYNNADHN